MVYKFKFSPVVFTFVFIILGLSLVSLTSLIYTLITYGELPVAKKVLYLSLILFTLFIALNALFALIVRKYVIKENGLTLRLGIFKSTVKIEKIVQFTVFNGNKLVAFFDDGKYTVIIVDEKDFDNFVRDVKTFNKKIIYSVKENGENS